MSKKRTTITAELNALGGPEKVDLARTQHHLKAVRQLTREIPMQKNPAEPVRDFSIEPAKTQGRKIVKIGDYPGISMTNANALLLELLARELPRVNGAVAVAVADRLVDFKSPDLLTQWLCKGADKRNAVMCQVRRLCRLLDAQGAGGVIEGDGRGGWRLRKLRAGGA